MESKDAKSGSNDEVDLRQFFQWIGTGIKNVGTSLIYGIASIRNMFFQNIKFFAVVILMGLVLGYIYSELLKKDYYKSSLVLNCIFLNTETLKNTIQTLNLLCEEKDKTGLKRELNLSDSVAKAVLSFEFKTFVSENDVIEMEVLKEQLNNLAEDKREVVDKIIHKLTIGNRDAYQITVTLTNPHVVKPLEEAIVTYFRNTNFIQKRIEASNKTRTERREKLISESKKLDSLKRLIFQNLITYSKTERGSNNVILDNVPSGNPLDIFKEDLRINQEILNIDRDLYLQQDFELVEGFTAINQPASPSLFKILIISFGIAWISGYFVLFAWKFDRMLAKYAKQMS